MKLTNAQQRMIERANRNEYNRDSYIGDNNIRSRNRLLELSVKYDRPFEGATRLHGSADFRVAYRLQELDAGRVCSCQIVDGYWFIAHTSTRDGITNG